MNPNNRAQSPQPQSPQPPPPQLDEGSPQANHQHPASPPSADDASWDLFSHPTTGRIAEGTPRRPMPASADFRAPSVHEHDCAAILHRLRQILRRAKSSWRGWQCSRRPTAKDRAVQLDLFEP